MYLKENILMINEMNEVWIKTRYNWIKLDKMDKTG